MKLKKTRAKLKPSEKVIGQAVPTKMLNQKRLKELISSREVKVKRRKKKK